MTHTKNVIASFSVAMIAMMVLASQSVAASEVTGTLSSAGESVAATTNTSGSITGSVSAPASGGGGGGSGVVISNGPPIAQGSAPVGVGSIVPGTNSNYSVTFPVAQAAPSPSTGTGGQVLGTAVYAPSRAALTGSVALVDDTVAEPIAATELPSSEAPIAQTPVEDPGQLASIMSSLGAGDLTTWIWLLLVLALLVAGGTYLYSRYTTEESVRY